MLVQRLIHRFRLLNAEPDAGGTGTGAAAPVVESDSTPSAVDNTLPTQAEASATPAAEPEKKDPPAPFAALTDALEKVGKPETPAPTAAPTPAPTAAPAAAKTPAPTPAPEVDLTPPEGMTDRAKERWSQLTERAKLVPELERRATEATTQLQSVRQLVNNSGLGPEEFTDMLEMARLFKAGDAKALQQLDGLRADLAKRLGVEAPGVDILADHPDLKAEVEAMTITKERALEIVRGRNADKRLQGIGTEQREQQQFQHTVQQAAVGMEQALAAKAGTPGHEAKLAYIKQRFSDPQEMQRFVSTYQPHQWVAAVTMLYDAYQPPAAAAPAGPQPLRPTAARVGAPVRTGPVTAESAVENALAKIGQ